MRFLRWPSPLGLVYLCTVLCLLALGLLTGYSAAEDEALYLVGAVRWTALALGAFVLGALLPLRAWLVLAPLLYAGTLVFLVLVLRSGITLYGATRWLSLGGLAFQPGELAKAALVLALASLAALPLLRGRPVVYAVLAALVATPAFLLVLRQPDLGTTVMLAVVLGAAVFFAGFPWRYILLFTALAVIAAPLIYAELAPYQRARIETFLTPDSDPLGAGWNVLQSQIAVGNGGLHGRGLFAGTQNQLGFLPVQESDFIYASLVEEQGFTGAALVGGLLALLILCIFLIALRSRSIPAAVVASATGTLIGVQSVVAIGMTIGLAPVTGIPLPFIARGGSALVAVMLLLGIIEGIRLRSRAPERSTGGIYTHLTSPLERAEAAVIASRSRRAAL